MPADKVTGSGAPTPSPSAPDALGKIRSNQGIVHSVVSVKSWMERLPSVDAVRPSKCPRCRAASRPVGAPLGLWGHGLRERHVRGPLDPCGEPTTVTIAERRYVCLACDAVIVVVPAEVEPYRHYSRSAIGLAIALFGIGRESTARIRRRVSPWRIVGAAAIAGWAMLRRWLKAVRRRDLFPCVRAIPEAWTLRQGAERVGATLAARAPLACAGLPLEQQAFVGACRMR